jgi:hypothetical protein
MAGVKSVAATTMQEPWLGLLCRHCDTRLCNAASVLALLPRGHEQLAQIAIIAHVRPHIQADLESAIEYLPRPRQWSAHVNAAPLAPANSG